MYLREKSDRWGMINTTVLVLGCLILTISVISIVNIIHRDRRSRTEKMALLDRFSAYHVEDYHADTRCDICFDSMDGEEVSECSCGKCFHRSCAEPTNHCPYCGNPFERFPIKGRESRSMMCFRCGKRVEHNICECGTVIPFKDGMFQCLCGEMLSEESTWCPNCGRTFERRTALADKTLFPKAWCGNDGRQIQTWQKEIHRIRHRPFPDQGIINSQIQRNRWL